MGTRNSKTKEAPVNYTNNIRLFYGIFKQGNQFKFLRV